MLFSTGDLHGLFSRFSSKKGFFPEQTMLSKEDCVIIPGDFGGVWNPEGESDFEKQNLDFLENRPFTTIFCDGNHENHSRLNNYPVKTWNNGIVHEIRPSILHLIRGEVYTLNDGYKVFSFGGARSHDISGGVLHKDDPDYYKQLANAKRSGKPYRIEGFDIWYDKELPSIEEMEHGLQNLEKHNNKVDLIVSHDCPSSVLNNLYANDRPTTTTLNDYLEVLRINVRYKLWIFGHHHIDKKIDDRMYCLYNQIVRIH